MTMLLNRPSPEYSETIASYLRRLSKSNHIALNTMTKAFDLPMEHQLHPFYLMKHFSVIEPGLRSIEKHTKLQPGTLTLKVPQQLDPNNVSWYGLVINLNIFRRSAATCLTCLKNNNTENNCWYLQCYCYCKRHKIETYPCDKFYLGSNRTFAASIDQAFTKPDLDKNLIININERLQDISREITKLKQASEYVPILNRPPIAIHSSMKQGSLLDA